MTLVITMEPEPPLQLMPMNFCGNNIVAQGVADQDDRKPQVMEAMEFGTINDWNNLTGLSQIPWWVQQYHQEEASSNQNYVEYLAQNPGLVSQPDMMLDSLPFPVSSEISFDVSGLPDFHTDLHYNHYLGHTTGFTSNELDNAWKVQYNEDLELQAQNHNLWMQNSNGDSSYNNVSQVNTPSTRVDALVGSPTKKRSRASNAKPKVNDRQRRIRINERLTALQKLLPHSREGCQASILDDVIDHIKYLQLQIKDLCKSKIESQCDSTTVPIIFREGYGHYFCDQPVLNEPLEEMLGTLLELNPLEAIQLLQRKGLLLMPIEFAEGLS